jgi:hypothetical protein
MVATQKTALWRMAALGLVALLLALGLGAYFRSRAAGEGGVRGGEAVGGDEPTVTYTAPEGTFSFQHPQSWGQTTQPGERIRYTGRDEFISVAIVATPQPPLDYARADAGTLVAASPGYQGQAPVAQQVAGRNGAMVAYTWQPPASAVTGKPVPSSARRYYIPGPGGTLAVLTYSSPTPTYDPAGADDFANAFAWGK